jgi:hypothetical protein
MSLKSFMVKQIVFILWEAEVALGRGQTVKAICRPLRQPLSPLCGITVGKLVSIL